MLLSTRLHLQIYDIMLIREVAKTGKPVIISTGLSNFEDLELAVKTLRDNDCNQIFILNALQLTYNLLMK